MKRTTKEVAKLAGVTLRQLQWWGECGLVQTVKRHMRTGGLCREFSGQDTYKVLLIADLRRKGLSLERTRAVLDFLESYTDQWLHWPCGFLVLSESPQIAKHQFEAIRMSCDAKGGVIVVDLLALTQAAAAEGKV